MPFQSDYDSYTPIVKLLVGILKVIPLTTDISTVYVRLAVYDAIQPSLSLQGQALLSTFFAMDTPTGAMLDRDAYDIVKSLRSMVS